MLRRSLSLLLSAVFGFVFIMNGGLAFAINQYDHDSIITNTPYYNPASQSCVLGTSGSSAPPDQVQAQNAQTVIGIAKTENLGQAGALIGLMVGLAESHLQNEANSNMPASLAIPHEGEGSDYDSVGIFQQRVVTGWSTLAPGDGVASNTPSGSQNYSNGHPDALAQIMTPAYAAEAFFGSPPGADAPRALSKGLQNHVGWQAMEPWVAAQAVQGSAFSDGGVYKAVMAQAQQLIGQFWDSAQPVALPVAFNAPASSGSSGGNATFGGCLTSLASGDEVQLAQRILDNKNITFDYGPEGIVAQPFHELAAGQKASTAIPGQPTDVSTTLLGFILDIAQTHRVNVSSLTTEHKAGDVHSIGDAVDINILDGVHVTGRDDGSHKIIDIALQALPKGTRFGQVNCPGSSVKLPSGYSEFEDSCTHLHIDVPKGTP